jgi:rod shape determining protein RodA
MPKSLYFDRYLFIAMTLLCVISLVFLFRFDQIEGIKYGHQFSQSFLLRQSINILVGVFFFFLFWQIDLSSLKKMALPLFGLSLLMVALTYFFGSHVMGAKRFIHLGIFSFQPSEIMKFTFVLFLAALYADRKNKIENAFQLIWYLVVLAVPFALVFKQPDLGTAVVFIAIFLGLSYKADVPPKLFFLVASPLMSMLAIHMLPFPELFSWIGYGFFLVIFLIFTRINWIEKISFFLLNASCGKVKQWTAVG